MSPIEARFRFYADQATDREYDALSSEGLEAGVIQWMETSEVRARILNEWLAGLAHQSLLARGDEERAGAVDHFRSGLRLWVSRYVDSWTDEERQAFMAECDEAARQAKMLDMAECRTDWRLDHDIDT